MPWGSSRGRGLGDITGWLVSPPPSPSTLDRGTPSNTQTAHPKHIISTVTLLSSLPSPSIVGEIECIYGYAQRYHLVLIHQHEHPSSPTSVAVSASCPRLSFNTDRTLCSV